MPRHIVVCSCEEANISLSDAEPADFPMKKNSTSYNKHQLDDSAGFRTILFDLKTWIAKKVGRDFTYHPNVAMWVAMKTRNNMVVVVTVYHFSSPTEMDKTKRNAKRRRDGEPKGEKKEKKMKCKQRYKGKDRRICIEEPKLGRATVIQRYLSEGPKEHKKSKR